ncbi:MAG: hypothetical protein Q9169_008501, partial [Polycauliona sp. 2 TL-2023]
YDDRRRDSHRRPQGHQAPTSHPRQWGSNAGAQQSRIENTRGRQRLQIEDRPDRTVAGSYGGSNRSSRRGP